MASSSDMIIISETVQFERQLFFRAVMSYLIDNSRLTDEIVDWFYNHISSMDLEDYKELSVLEPHLFPENISIFYENVLENQDGFFNPLTERKSRILDFDEIRQHIK